LLQNGDVDLRQNRKNQRPSSMYETREGLKTPNWQILKNQMKQNEQTRNTTQSLYGIVPDSQTIIDCTNLITKSIQHLCKTINDRDNEDCLASGEKVKIAIAKLATILPKDKEGRSIKFLCDVLPLLMVECSSLQGAHKKSDGPLIDHHTGKIREYAFLLAKQTREVVARYSTAQ
jgi:G protein-coupled receptor kinase interacting protein 2